jgi:hypothetical protein
MATVEFRGISVQNHVIKPKATSFTQTTPEAKMIFFSDTEGVYNHRWTLSVRTLVVTESLEPLAFVVVLSTCFKPFFEFHNSHESKAVEKHSAFTSESKTGLSSQCP